MATVRSWWGRSRVARSVLVGLVFGVAVAALAPLFTPARGPVVVLPGLLAGAVMAMFDLLAIRAREDGLARAREALGCELTPELRRDALRGPVSTDPVVREQQRRVVDHFLARLRAGASRSEWIVGLNLLLHVAIALFVSPFFWVTAAMMLFSLALTPWEIRRLRRRQQRLSVVA